ncbi:MAG: threonine aldolase family protein [bacterium JZ-2024 1]
MATRKRVIDLRSDTVTRPTPKMLQAMMKAKVGDDVLGDDPTVKKLERLAARMVGKQEALFVPSGTMGNEIAIKILTREGEEVVLDNHSHIYLYELSGISLISRAFPRAVHYPDGVPDPEEIRKVIRKNGVYSQRTSVICLENTHNFYGGKVVPLESFREIRQLADWYEIYVHLDAARIFNASVASGIPAEKYAHYADTVMFCLSKGLCCPVGSVLCGSVEMIKRARKIRRLLGGGMRQAGYLAAAGIVALKTLIPRLKKDHENARLLASLLSPLPSLSLAQSSVDTNILYFSLKHPKMNALHFTHKLKSFGILALPISETVFRMVTHKDVSREDIYIVAEVCQSLLSS